MAGDFNLVQDIYLDFYNYTNINNKRTREKVLNMKVVHSLIDPWIVKYAQRKRYTSFRTNPTKKTRIDFFLISNELMALLDKSDILPGYRSDHSMVYIEIYFN